MYGKFDVLQSCPSLVGDTVSFLHVIGAGADTYLSHGNSCQITSRVRSDASVTIVDVIIDQPRQLMPVVLEPQKLVNVHP